MSWQPYDGGMTIGTTGSEGGVIKTDDEYTGAARITLEEGCLHAPYAITCGVYGFLYVHTRFLADDETALYALDDMKAGLAAIVNQIPGEDDPDYDVKQDAIEQAVSNFVRQFP
jgi:hypothetical protein